jgi:hypothetical protein
LERSADKVDGNFKVLKSHHPPDAEVAFVFMQIVEVKS